MRRGVEPEAKDIPAPETLKKKYKANQFHMWCFDHAITSFGFGLDAFSNGEGEEFTRLSQTTTNRFAAKRIAMICGTLKVEEPEELAVGVGPFLFLALCRALALLRAGLLLGRRRCQPHRGLFEPGEGCR